MLDTSTVIMLGQLRDDAGLPDELLITAVTLAELSVGPHVVRSEHERANRQIHLQQAEADFDPLPFDTAAARAFGRVAASLRQQNRTVAVRASDAMIAATAMSNGLAIHTSKSGRFPGDRRPRCGSRSAPGSVRARLTPRRAASP